MPPVELFLLIDFAAAFSGILVALALLFQERFSWPSASLELGGSLLGFSLLLAFFVLLDMEIVPPSLTLVLFLNCMGITAAALFLNYIRGAVASRSMTWPAYVPVPLYALAALTWPRPLPQFLVIDALVYIHVAYTAVALFIFLAARARLPDPWRRRPENRLLPLLIGGICLVHIAQISRIAFPDTPFLFDLVPLTAAIGILTLSAYVLMGSQTLRVLSPARAPAAMPTIGSATILRQLEETRSFLDPDISLPRLAGELNLRPRELSETINAEMGKSFRELINDLRIKEAQHLLMAGEERLTSVEAIALLAGFRSRSSFYEAFKQRVGKTPAEFRNEAP